MSRPPRSPRASQPSSAHSGQGRVRIVGGRWRNTRLVVPDLPGLRPTGERVRETVFNWLMPVLPGARVLDLFAGSGALGLEAVSRGANSATLVERDLDLAALLHRQVARLDAGSQVQVVQADALYWLAQLGQGNYDLVFVDPPFAAGLWEPVLAILPARLTQTAWLYLESPVEVVPALPGEWQLHREGTAGEVRYALYRRAAGTLRSDLNSTIDA